MINMYDSREETQKHIDRVYNLLCQAASNLIQRGRDHDKSKLEDFEKPYFDQVSEKLKGLTYGSDEYKASLAELQIALNHHYENNSHHPEHHTNGINDMDLFDILEMFFDWKAATERHEDGNIYKSIEFNKNRFGMSEQLVNIFTNTAKNMKY